VRLFVYTSLLRADRSCLSLAGEHRETEDAIRASGLSFVLLRNGWYTENYTENLAPALEHGAIVGCARDGQVAAATRADYAAAAVAVLTNPGRAGKVYELSGDVPFTMPELAAAVSKAVGRTIGYADLPPAQYKNILLGAGLPECVADLYVDFSLGALRGDLSGGSDDLRRLIGRRTTPLADAVAEAVGH
jgi:NAD(P)H dehydrogenase (quinone)